MNIPINLAEILAENMTDVSSTARTIFFTYPIHVNSQKCLTVLQFMFIVYSQTNALVEKKKKSS